MNVQKNIHPIHKKCALKSVKKPKHSHTPWMDLAWSELHGDGKKIKSVKGLKEHEEPLKSMVIKYHNYVAPEKNYGAGISWCASFASWCLGEANIENPKHEGSRMFIDHQTLKTRIYKPAYGAIAVFRDFVATETSSDFTIGDDTNPKTVVFNEEVQFICDERNHHTAVINKEGEIIFNQHGGYGHVNFVVGVIKNKEESLIACLGGNQGNQVRVSKYDYTKNLVHAYYSDTKQKEIYRAFIGFYIPPIKNFESHCTQNLISYSDALLADKSTQSSPLLNQILL